MISKPDESIIVKLFLLSKEIRNLITARKEIRNLIIVREYIRNLIIIREEIRDLIIVRFNISNFIREHKPHNAFFASTTRRNIQMHSLPRKIYSRTSLSPRQV